MTSQGGKNKKVRHDHRIFYENHLALTQFPSRQHLRIALAIVRPTHQYHVARVNAYKAFCLRIKPITKLTTC